MLDTLFLLIIITYLSDNHRFLNIAFTIIFSAIFFSIIIRDVVFNNRIKIRMYQRISNINITLSSYLLYNKIKKTDIAIYF